MTSLRSSPVLAFSLVVGLIFGGAALVAGHESWRAALSAAIPIGYGVVVTLLARRSETAGVLAGRPVDERWERFNLEASAWALGASAIVVLAAFVVADATGGDWTPYAFIAAVMAIAYAGSLGILRLRG